MHEYDFISTTITVEQVRSIITKAGYQPSDYTYTPRAGHDGYLVRGGTAMSLTSLRNAAKALKITVEISSPPSEEMEVAEVENLGATPYAIGITMSQTTVDTLTDNGFSLYAFKAVQTTTPKGAPLVWFKTSTFGLTTKVTWTEKYQAYTSNSQIVPNGQVVATNSYDADLGNTLTVKTASGTGDVTVGGVATAITIYNSTDTQFVCGISEQTPDGTTNPMCAFPLFGGSRDVIAPIEKMLLMFATDAVDTGTVIEQAFTDGLMIDLTASNQRAVGYVINKGWTPTDQSWAKPVASGTDLVAMLIDKPHTNVGLRSLVHR